MSVNSKQRVSLAEPTFQRICQLIYRQAGIVLGKNKHEMVYNRLIKRLQILGLNDFDHYIQLLERDLQHSEWQCFINALTTNLTAFFREAHHFPILAAHAQQRQRDYRVWSAAASTGEEAYSIAITLMDTLGRGILPRVLASDIDTQVLATAEKGIYRHNDVSSLSTVQIKRYFLRGTGQQQGLVRVRPELSASVHFLPINLLAPHWPITEPVDAIFCRNVMIYFDKKTQKQIISQFLSVLKPGGLLFAGHSENFCLLSSQLAVHGPTVYCLANEKR